MSRCIRHPDRLTTCPCENYCDECNSRRSYFRCGHKIGPQHYEANRQPKVKKSACEPKKDDNTNEVKPPSITPITQAPLVVIQRDEGLLAQIKELETKLYMLDNDAQIVMHQHDLEHLEQSKALLDRIQQLTAELYKMNHERIKDQEELKKLSEKLNVVSDTSRQTVDQYKQLAEKEAQLRELEKSTPPQPTPRADNVSQPETMKEGTQGTKHTKKTTLKKKAASGSLTLKERKAIQERLYGKK